MLEGSAVAAMAALRTLVEERLLQNEDYRALKALDRAIAESRSPQAKAAGRPIGDESPVASQQGHLQQKLAERYGSASV